MLVIMKNRNFHLRAQALLDFKAFRGLDVFQIDAAKGWFQCGDNGTEFVRIGLIDLDIKHIDTGEFLEQDGLTFHHRLGRQGTNRPQAQHGGPIGDHTHQIGTRRQIGGLNRVTLNLTTGCGHTGGIGQAEIALCRQRFGCDDRQFPGR